MFGRNEEGRSVHVATHFRPYFFVKGRSPGKQYVKRKDLWGFQNLREHVFSLFDFDTLEEFREEQRKIRHGLYEANIDPLLRFMHRTGIRSTGWAELDETLCEQALMSSSSDFDFFVNDWKTLKSIPDRDDMAPFRISSVDIECYSQSGQFPDSLKPTDVCFQIAVTTKCRGEYIDRRVFGVKTEFGTEREMLDAFVKHLRHINPDVITGWNIFGFDLEYIYNRMLLSGCTDFVLGRLDDEDCELTVKNLSSNALGNNTLKMVKMTGRYVFDMYQEIKREHKFESYSLNNVSKILLGDQKLDMPVREIFSRFASGQGLEEVAEYCVKDTELPHAISEKLSLFQNLVEMAKACWVPLNFLSERGQQIKVFSQMAHAARELGFMIPTIRNRNEESSGYQGATVLEAQTGAYYEPITALDFASLYPSIMCAHNLCYSTLVMDKQYMDIPGVTYERFGPHVFALEKDGVRVPSLLPIILERLKVYRKEAKRMMETCEPELYNVYNGKQLAYKISMNSVYGFTGAVTKGILPCMPIAETVTMRGRQMIEQSKAYVEENFPGAKVRYGDSVMPGTPVLVRCGTWRNGRQIPIEQLAEFGKWKSYPGFLKEGTEKEQIEPSKNIQSFTHMGWKTIRRVIRHKCNKKILRIYTSEGSMVDVTEDHSLITPDIVHIKPYDLTVGSELLAIGSIEHVSTISLLHESWDGYVYDIETEAGTFQAGIGSLIVKNTDSIMVQFDVEGRTGQEAIEHSWKLGERASKEISALFRSPNKLELEKVYCPYFLYSKKRYAAKMWTEKVSPDGLREVKFDKIDVKGLQVVRRDSCKFVRDTCKRLLETVLESQDPSGAVALAREAKDTLLNGRVSTEDLVLTKSLAADYKVKMPHVEVVKKMRERNPGSEPQIGSRVPFVVAKTKKGLDKLFEKAEDPEWVKEKRIPLDYEYYFEHQLKKPVEDLLEPLVDTSEVFATQKKSRKITEFFATKV
jgi:DNA polymerase elongation subunit (family B)